MKKSKEKHDFENIIIDYNSGFSRQQIVKKYQIPESTLNRYFFDKRKEHNKKISIDTMLKINILKLKGNKKKNCEIAKELKVKESVVIDFLEALKITKQLFLKKGLARNAKNFSEATVRMIRKDYATGNFTQRELAKKNNTTLSTVFKIVRFKSYKYWV